MNNKIKEYLNQNKSLTFNNLLFSYIDDEGYKDTEVYKRADIDRKLFSKIRCNSNYIPKKNTVIKLCLSLSLDKNRFNIFYVLDDDLNVLFIMNEDELIKALKGYGNITLEEYFYIRNKQGI